LEKRETEGWGFDDSRLVSSRREDPDEMLRAIETHATARGTSPASLHGWKWPLARCIVLFRQKDTREAILSDWANTDRTDRNI